MSCKSCPSREIEGKRDKVLKSKETVLNCPIFWLVNLDGVCNLRCNVNAQLDASQHVVLWTTGNFDWQNALCI